MIAKSSHLALPRLAWRRPSTRILLSAALLLGTTTIARACPFCSGQGKTLSEDVADATVVLHGILSDAKIIPDAPAGEADGSTKLKILTVLKSHPAIEGKKEIVLPRFIAAAERQPAEYLLFAEVVKDRVDPFRGMPVDNPKFIEYLTGAVRLGKADVPQRLAFCFSYLNDDDPTISGDAYREFANAPYADVLKAAPKFDPDLVITWLKDKRTAAYRVGLYGCLLGACGRTSDAGALKEIVVNPELRPLTGVDGIMGGYCVLDPKNGPGFVLDILASPSNDFNFRYSALRTVRFILTEMPEIDRAVVFQKMGQALQIPDIADLIIDEFRRYQVWSHCETILALYDAPKFSLQVVRRAVIRFALKCPNPSAQEFVAKLREKNPQLVADVEEILRFEEVQQVPISTSK